MKTTNKIALMLTVLIGFSISSCKKDQFVELNTNPQIIDLITPQQQFMNSILNMHGDRFEYYYDNFRAIMPWMQMVTPLNGNSVTFISDAANFRNVRYNNFYPKVGGNLTDMEQLIKKLPAEEQAKRIYQVEIARIVKAYYAFYVSDVTGSLAYTEAFMLRYGGTETPKYNTQESLFEILDTQLKNSVTILSTSQPVAQTSLAENDLFYQGAVANWIKVANSARLRMAMRLMKRDPAKMKTKVLEILAAPGGLINSAADGWVFRANATYADGGDWSAGGLRAPKQVVDFMYTNSDPRIRLFYQENSFTRANFDLAKAQNKIAASSVFDTRRFYGVPSSPDASSSPAFANFFNNISISVVNATNQTVNQTMDSLSFIQPRLFAAGENGGKGMNAFPIITYADVCFMRAELAARNVTTESAEDWYNKGVTASISFYDDLANKAQIVDRTGALSYVAVSPAEISNYMAKADIKYDASKGLDQIIGQAYLNFFKQPNEAWAIYKRTGMPNSTTVLKLEKIMASGTEQVIPRRASLPFPAPTNLNYQNIVDAYKLMQADPDFGQGPSDITGRVWWDKK
ncbi:SusD/RagB family nutrient-binding outer membrane lipoprotein [Pedobacter jeongneungensis]|uniref:SusD/RagB family nutrient-binding outer membrane lipoprotein n=1 Tax=Pedobacter jeongneungensis TaxID=947309 RepID=UPI0004691F7B|nr:SusD/RagB family nutrient-binding outer membrane lipoprotein [Pedobacter jeongneungensis]